MTVLFIFIIALSAIVPYLVFRSMKRPLNYPPGPEFVPYVGNTMQLRKYAKLLGGQHLAFEKWAEDYGTNILGLKLQNELVVVVLSYPFVREVQIEETFEGRPDNFFFRLRTMGTRKGITCTDGQLWYDHRNWVMRQMRNVGYGRTEMQRHIQDETKGLIDCIDATKGEPVWPGSFLAVSVMNVIWTLTAGKRFDRDDKRFMRLLKLLSRRSKIFDVSGGILTQFPWLRYIMPEKTGYNLIKQLNEELYNLFMEIIQEHKMNLELECKIDPDLIYAYLSEMKSRTLNEEIPNSFNEIQLIMTILDLFIAGSQTTSNTIDLALMMLALRKDIQSKVYEELSTDHAEEYANLSSRFSHPFVNAFLMEVQRFFHIVPISGPRRALKNSTLAGFNIPKNTTILISLRSVHMDKEHWGDPEKFRPERFLDEMGKLRNDEYFMSFGQGRRRCLGDALAKGCLFSFIVKIVEKYKIELCENDKPSLILEPGITLSAKPYKIRFLKRNLQ